MENELKPLDYYWLGYTIDFGNLSDNNGNVYISSFPNNSRLKYFCEDRNITILSKGIEKLLEGYQKLGDLKHITFDNFISFLVGIIDSGAGFYFYTKNNNLVVNLKKHVEWSKLLEYVFDKLNNILPESNKTVLEPDNNGYIQCSFGKASLLKVLDSVVEKYKLPVTQDKWSQVKKLLRIRNLI